MLEALTRRGTLVAVLLLGCAPESAATWTFETTAGARSYEASAAIDAIAGGERLAIGYASDGASGVADDEVEAWIYVDLAALPDAPSTLPIAGRVGYAFGGLAGVAQPPDETRWTFAPAEGNDPAVQRVLVYWGVFRPAEADYEGDVTGTLTFEAITDREVRGTLHLDVGSDAAGTGGTPFFAGPTTSDVTFVAHR